MIHCLVTVDLRKFHRNFLSVICLLNLVAETRNDIIHKDVKHTFKKTINLHLEM